MFRKIFASALGLTSILLMSLLGACSSYEPLARTKIIRSANEISPVDESVLVCAGDNKAKYKDVKAAVDQHVLVVNSWGHVKGDTYRDRFLKIIKAFEKSKSRHMLIYVNGGLNSETVILNRAARQIRCMTKNTDYFPVFLAWKTGAFETYFDQITYARNGVRHRNAQISAPMYLFGDIGQGLARAPITFYNSGRRFLESTLIVDKDEYTLSDDIRKIKERRPEYRNVDIDWDADTKPAEALPTKLLKVTGYALAWPGRILTTPFLDSMGKTAWENMLRHSRLTVRAVTDFQPEYRDGDAEALKSDRKCYPNGTGGFSRFFQDIQRYINGTKPENKQCEIWPCSAPGSLDTSLSHAAGLIEIAACHA